jgi:hypothetical protein
VTDRAGGAVHLFRPDGARIWLPSLMTAD